MDGPKRTPWRGPPPDEETIRRRFADEGLVPHAWSNAPGDTYGRHRHGTHKVLYCASGSIVFHTPQGDVELRPGDRLDLPAGCDHAATVGAHGVTCYEAHRPEGLR